MDLSAIKPIDRVQIVMRKSRSVVSKRKTTLKQVVEVVKNKVSEAESIKAEALLLEGNTYKFKTGGYGFTLQPLMPKN